MIIQSATPRRRHATHRSRASWPLTAYGTLAILALITGAVLVVVAVCVS